MKHNVKNTDVEIGNIDQGEDQEMEVDNPQDVLMESSESSKTDQVSTKNSVADSRLSDVSALLAVTSKLNSKTKPGPETGYLTATRASESLDYCLKMLF